MWECWQRDDISYERVLFEENGKEISLHWKQKKKCIDCVCALFYCSGYGFFYLLFDFWKVTCWSAKICVGFFFFYLFFYIELFDIHPNNLKCCPAEKSPSAALKTKVFKEEFVCMLWFCEAVLFVVQRMKLWQLRNMGNILILTPTECVDVVS